MERATLSALFYLRCMILQILGLLGFLFFQQGATTAAPVVEWANGREHDFGKMRQGAPRSYAFQFKNVSKDSIRIETVRTSCGCTAADWAEKPIAPGQTGEISIEYDAYMRGSFNKKIRVFFDAQRKPEILRIRGDVD